MVDKLMVVAHPDDEIIFGGAHLLREKNWMVVCITNGDNKTRRQEFKKIMKQVGVAHQIWSYRDTYSYNFDSTALQRDLQKLLKTHHFKKVVTHGLCGEYGHPQHQIIGQIMRKIVPHNLYTFSFSKKRLPSKLIRKKIQLINGYSSQIRTIKELIRNDSLGKYISKEYLVLVKR